jgi:multimeric flavodoxin WrbA
MKILAISGSPRKRNTYSALNSIQEQYPDIDFKILRLDKVNLEMCRGCYVCVLRGEDKCPIKDDRDMIINEMLEADGIIFASPVYCIHITALMKNFIDRLGFYAHRPRFYDKFAMTMVTCSGYGGADANKYMTSQFSAHGFNMVSSLELQIWPGTISEKKKRDNHEKTMTAFNTLIAKIEKGERNAPSLGLLVPFNLFKTISQLEKDVMKADYEYYKDKGDFWYDTKIPFYKTMIAKRVVKKILSEDD